MTHVEPPPRFPPSIAAFIEHAYVMQRWRNHDPRIHTVILRPDEDIFFGEVAVCRRSYAEINGLLPKNFAPTDGPTATRFDKLGMFCEGVGVIYYWPNDWDYQAVPRPGILRPDFTEGRYAMEIRGRDEDTNPNHNPKRHDLIVHEPPSGDQKGDPPDRIYILVHRIDGLVGKVKGWMWGDEAQQKKFWVDNIQRPAFFIPPEKLLHTPDELWWMLHLERVKIADERYARGEITFSQLALVEVHTDPERDLAFMRWLEAVGDRVHDRQRGRLKGET